MDQKFKIEFTVLWREENKDKIDRTWFDSPEEFYYFIRSACND